MTGSLESVGRARGPAPVVWASAGAGPDRETVRPSAQMQRRSVLSRARVPRAAPVRDRVRRWFIADCSWRIGPLTGIWPRRMRRRRTREQSFGRVAASRLHDGVGRDHGVGRRRGVAGNGSAITHGALTDADVPTDTIL